MIIERHKLIGQKPVIRRVQKVTKIEPVKNGDYIGPKGSRSGIKGDPKVIENYSVSQSELDDFRTLLKTELGLEHF